MARPSATPGAARAVVRVCLNVTFVALVLTFVCLSRRRGVGGGGGAPCPFPKNRGALLVRACGHGGGVRRLGSDEGRCGGGLAAGTDDHADDHARGYVDYLYLFYCILGGGEDHRALLGYGAMAAWLAVLFYVLGDTAAVYFCSSLEGLARLLGLSPAMAGVTLLSLGNGAPDALSTVASFTSAGDGGRGKGGTAAVGLNGVLGGTLFVSSAVLGVIGLRLGGERVAVDRASFFRDAAFLLLALTAVAVVLAVGEVTVWCALAFASLYIVYVLAVAFTPDHWNRRHDAEAEHDAAAAGDSSELHNVAETKFYTNHEAQESLLPNTAPLLHYYAGHGDGDGGVAKRNTSTAFWVVVRVLELPLRLPRWLTIPDASKERWSKPAAVTAATLAPIFLSFLCRHAFGNPSLAVLLGCLTGLCLGVLAFLTTDAAAPPTRFLAPWLAGGFVMSVAWAYVVANEVLSLLVSAGVVLSVDTATLGVTVLAWGNSLGDLVTNVAVAVASRGGGGAQVAVSGCYGGPVFNILMGLGLSMLLSCWAGYPQPVAIPRESELYQTLGFLVAGLLWAVAMLPRRGMRVDRTLGLGLLAMYFCFLCINISQVLGPKGKQ